MFTFVNEHIKLYIIKIKGKKRHINNKYMSYIYVIFLYTIL